MRKELKLNSLTQTKMKTYRQFMVSVIPRNGTAPCRVLITDPGSDVRKSIATDAQPAIGYAVHYLESIGIQIHGLARAIREQDVRLLSESDQPLR